MKCLDDTIYFHSPVKARWPMARFYCQSIFAGYQRADILYFSGSYNLSNFETFASEIGGYINAGSESMWPKVEIQFVFSFCIQINLIILFLSF